MALTKISTDGFEDDSVTDAKLANAINSAIAANTAKDLTNLNAGNITSGTIPDARFPNALPAISGANLTNLPFASLQADINTLTINLALLAFRISANGSLAKYNLTDQTVDDFVDTSGIDASASTNEVRNASGKYYSGAATNHPTGGTVTTYTSGGNNYRVHSITVDGNFVVPAGASGIVDMLIVGAGGGGGNYLGGGGGGGEVLYVQNRTLSAATYAVQVGVGGLKGEQGVGSPWYDNGRHGEGSYFGADYATTNLYARGGGGGSGHGSGYNQGAAGADADGVASTAITGTGNGGGGASTGAGSGAAYTPTNRTVSAPSGETWNIYGSYAGGTGQAGGNHVGGGGAGSYAAGGGPVTGIGGNGIPNDILGTSYYWAGGGGGGSITLSYSSWGAGGLGGGGGGSSQNSPTGLGGGSALNAGGNAQQQGLGGTGGANTGSGGGGGGHGDYDGGAGADGIVIVRYTTDQFLNFNDLTLQSVDSVAGSVPTKADLVMLYEDGVGVATLNTDIKAFISRDSGVTFTQGTLVAEGVYGSNKKIVAFHDLDISSQPSGSNVCYKITTHNQSSSKETRIHAVSHGWS